MGYLFEMRSFGVFVFVLVISLHGTTAAENCSDTGSSPADCTCVSSANFTCTGSYDSFECMRSGFLECKYRYQGGYYCQKTHKWAASAKPTEPTIYLTAFNGVNLSTTNMKGLGQCTHRMCIDGISGGMTNEDCYCPCKEGSDTCCKYSKMVAGVKNYGCVTARSWKDFKKASQDNGEALTVVPGFEQICPDDGKNPFMTPPPTAPPTPPPPTAPPTTPPTAAVDPNYNAATSLSTPTSTMVLAAAVLCVVKAIS